MVLRVLYNLFVLNGYKGILFSVWSRTSVLKEPHAAPEPQVGDPWPRPVARIWNPWGLFLSTGGLNFFLPFFPQTVYLKDIEVIKVCPTNLWKPFPMIKKKWSHGRKRTLFWLATALQRERMQAKCKANALHCRMPTTCTPPTSRFLGVLQVARQIWTCSFLSDVARFRADSGNARQMHDKRKMSQSNQHFQQILLESPSSRQTNLC